MKGFVGDDPVSFDSEEEAQEYLDAIPSMSNNPTTTTIKFFEED